MRKIIKRAYLSTLALLFLKNSQMLLVATGHNPEWAREYKARIRDIIQNNS